MLFTFAIRALGWKFGAEGGDVPGGAKNDKSGDEESDEYLDDAKYLLRHGIPFSILTRSVGRVQPRRCGVALFETLDCLGVHLLGVGENCVDLFPD